METTQQQFDQTYWLSKPDEVRALPSLSAEARAARAAELAQQGFIIDVPIMVWGWDPFLCMTMREQFGYTWVPSALQPPLAIAPGLSQAGVVSYNPLRPPPGSIMVSTNIQDYPPFDPPPPATPAAAPITDPVGAQSVGTLYFSVPGEMSPDGTKFTDPRGTFKKHLVVTPFGKSAYWEKIVA
jgi:hypothetical protein